MMYEWHGYILSNLRSAKGTVKLLDNYILILESAGNGSVLRCYDYDTCEVKNFRFQEERFRIQAVKDDFLLLSDRSVHRSVLLNLQTGDVLWKIPFDSFCIIDEQRLVVGYERDGIYYNGLLKYEGEVTLWEFQGHQFFENTAVGLLGFPDGIQNSSGFQIFRLVDTYTGKVVWEFEVKTLGGTNQLLEKGEVKIGVKKLLGVHDETIWLALNIDMIIGIDAVSGRVKRLLGQDRFTEGRVKVEATQILHQEEKMIGCYGADYWEIDLKSGVVSVFDLREEFKTHEIVNGRLSFAYDSEYVFFVDHYRSKVAALNRRSKRVDWLYKLPEEAENKSLEKVFIQSGRLLLIDNGANVFVLSPNAYRK